MVIAFANQKGGVAKTTSVFNVGHELSKLGKKTLMIDFDPQGTLTIFCGIPHYELDESIANVMVGDLKIQDVIYEVDKKLHVAVGNSALASAEIYIVKTSDDDPNQNVLILKEAIRELQETHQYDYILIDSKPSLGYLMLNTLCAADRLVVPVMPDSAAYAGLVLIQETVDLVKEKYNPTLDYMGVLLTNVSGNLHERDVSSLIEEEYHILGAISGSVEVKNANALHLPVSDMKSRHGSKGQSIIDRIGNQYKEIARAIING